MPDPATLPAGAATAAATAITLTAAPPVAHWTDMPLELMIFGAIGALIAMIYSEPKQPPLEGVRLVLHAVGRLFSGCMVGGIGAAVALPLAASRIDWLAGVEQIPLAGWFAAIVLGIGTALIPDVLAWARNKFRGGAA